MLKGVHGPLVSTAFLESILLSSFEGRLGESTRGHGRRQLRAWWPTAVASLGPVSSLRAIADCAAAPLAMGLGYHIVDMSVRDDEALRMRLRTDDDEPVGLLVSRWDAELGTVWRDAVGTGIAIDAPWCLCFNGRQLRVIDTQRTYARRFLEFDLDVAVDDEFAFGVLWGLLRADALARISQSDSRNRQREPCTTLLAQIVDASERHQIGVCSALQDGVHTALVAVGQALVQATRGRGRAHPTALSLVFEQSLTVVYRILFLLFAEARGLLPVWHPTYRDSYTIASLGRQVERTRHARGLWDALQAIARLAHAGCEAGELRVTAFNGRLFSPAWTPLAERANVDDNAIRRALLALTTRASKIGVGYERIGYRDLGVEQLGSVYERVLDFAPRVEEDGRGRPHLRLHATRRQRKSTGSFYTPRSITDYLVRQTLHPLVQRASADAILNIRVLDPAMGSGAFLVGACRYLSAAYEAARIHEGACSASDVTERERGDFRRLVAQRCLFGVDVNPMAVQLARLSLWLTTLSADRPLTFFDHHLRVGDSLAGAATDDLTRQPPGALGRNRRRSDESLPLFDAGDMPRAMQSILPPLLRMTTEPDDSAATVRRKERTLATLTASGSLLSRWKAVVSLWCAYWFWHGHGARPPATAFPPLADAILHGHSILPQRMTRTWLRVADGIAADRRFFHWRLEFPEVFFDERGHPLANPGFDAVLANPPWDVMRADEGDAEQRRQARTLTAQLTRFTRDSGVYQAQAGGHANTYQLFVERAFMLTRRGGRVGLVAPSGLATDHGCRRLRQLLLDRSDTDTLISLDNRRAIFPVHRSVKFLLLTSTAGRPTTRVRCRFGERDPRVLDAIEDGADGVSASTAFPVTLTLPLIARLSGDTLVIPDLRTSRDLAIVEKATAGAPRLGDPEGWGAVFGRELNASDDRRHFTERGPGLPVLAGRHIQPFVVDLSSCRFRIRRAVAARLLNREHSYGRPRLAYRDVASATNRVTIIAAIVPADAITTHTLFCLKTDLDRVDQHFLCGALNSYVVNYLARLRITTHATTAIMEGLPIPRPVRDGQIARGDAEPADRSRQGAVPAEARRRTRRGAMGTRVVERGAR